MTLVVNRPQEKIRFLSLSKWGDYDGRLVGGGRIAFVRVGWRLSFAIDPRFKANYFAPFLRSHLKQIVWQ